MLADYTQIDPDGDIVLATTSANESEDQTTMTIRARVSSRHLILASPVFKAMLTGGFKESRLQSTQVQEILLPDDDPEALLILLHIIHGLMWKVHRQVELQTLLEISILVDKYQLQQVVAIISELWIDHLWKSSTETRTKAFLQWICISWVFKKPLQFKESTKFAIRELDRPIFDNLVDERIPIPSRIADAIEQERQRAVGTIIMSLYSFQQQYEGESLVCPNIQYAYLCDSLILGALNKSLKSIGLIVRPVSPYRGLRFSDAVVRLQRLKIPTFCQSTDSIRGGFSTWLKTHDSPKATLEALVTALDKNLGGLDLHTFSGGEEEL